MNYENLIKNWHIKASEEDYFSKFVFEYLAFIAHIKTKLYREASQDRKAIQKLKEDQHLKEKYLKRVQNKKTLKNDWEHIKRTLDDVRLGNSSRNLLGVEEIEWWNCEHEELSQRTAEEKLKVKGIIHSLKDWGNMVEFWYSIRNNLFHGAKDPENERDQFAVKYGYRTLKELMELFISENE
jgi:hypothetical protein